MSSPAVIRLLPAAAVVLAGLVGACAPATPAALPTLTATPLASPPVLYPTPEPAPASPSAIGPAEAATLVITHEPDSLALAPLFVAEHKGFFRAEGLSVLLSNADDEASLLERFGSGQAPLVAASGEFGVAALRKDLPLRILFNSLDRNLWSVAVRADLARERGLTATMPLPERLRLLNGTVIGVTQPEGAAGRLASYYLGQVGSPTGQAARVIASGANLTLVSSLEAGFLDAIVAMPPTIEHAVLRGQSSMLVDNSRGQDASLTPYHMASLYASPAFVQDSPNTAAHVVRALDRASQWLTDTPPDEVARVLGAEWPEEDFAVLVASVESLQEAINENGALDPVAVANQLKVGGATDVTAEQVAALFSDTSLRRARAPAP